MIRIRTKLFIFLFILVVLLNSISFLLYQNGQRSAQQYNNILQRFFLLNEVSQSTTDVYKSLNTYLSERTPLAYQKFLQQRKELKNQQDKLSALQNEDNYLQVENYRNMITSFLQQTGITAGAFQSHYIGRYSMHLQEAKQISTYIQEMTLKLIDYELNRYQKVYDKMKKRSAYFNSMGIFVFISTVLMCTLFAVWFSRGITDPINRLMRSAHEISAGRFDGDPVRVSTNDEFRMLTHTFNDMRENTRQLFIETKRKAELDQLLKEMELKNLQSQINPHFLFNILNTISKTAYMEDAEHTNQLIESTAVLLRHNLSHLDKPVALSKEVEVIREYFFLQSARFGNRVKFYTHLDEASLSISIPSMTLQPIIENAFIHGIESYENGGIISLAIEQDEQFIWVKIKDNGVGMSEEMQRSLLDMSTFDDTDVTHTSGHSTGLGLKNVFRRLQLFYKREQLFDIYSIEGQGTTVILKLPIDQGGDN